MTQQQNTDPTRTVKAALGLPDATHGWPVGPFFVPYLSFSQAELDESSIFEAHWNAFVISMEGVSGPMTVEVAEAIAQLGRRRAALFATFFARRMGEGAPDAEAVYQSTDRKQLEEWQARTARGGAENPQ